ncbi:PAS domain-containing protein [Reinekea forsetii]|nr:PAS domain-containing protein [Reinekea forsetii]
MNFAWGTLVLVALAYLGVLLLTAYLAERGKIPNKLLKHPIVYVLAFGVSCSSWAYYGSVGMAVELKHGYLVFYIGLSVLLLFSAMIIRPLFKLSNEYQLSSLPDLFAFRYRSRWVGLITSLGVLMALLPLLVLQLQAITDVIVILDPDANTLFIAGLISLILLYITVLFGTRQVKPSEKHPGLIFALAIEALFKLIVFVLIGAIALMQLGDTPAEIQQWIQFAPANLSSFNTRIDPVQWFSLLLIFTTAPLVLPHLFQILFKESSQPQHLRIITWAAPLYLLLMALPVLPILWAGSRLGVDVSPEYFTIGLGLALENPALVWLTYLGGLSAAAGITIIASLSLSSMLLNHVIMPFSTPNTDVDIYKWLIWMRRILIACVFGATFAFYIFLNQIQNQTTLLMTSFTGLSQMLPGLIGLLFWSHANRKGFIAGTLVGLITWGTLQFWPILTDSIQLTTRLPIHFAFDRDAWTHIILLSVSANALTFFVVSLLTKTSAVEKNSAEICVITRIDRRQRLPLQAKNAREFTAALSKPLGQVMAEQEVNRALKKLKLNLSEYRPYALRRLRDTIEANLSGMMGPSVSTALVSRYLPYEDDHRGESDDIHFLEQNLDNYHYQLSGMSAELDRLRRHHRETLYRLPIGVCSLTQDGEILLWNELMASLTGINEKDAIGAKIESLPGEWYDLLDRFLKGNETKVVIEQEGVDPHQGTRWFSLHRTRFDHRSDDLNEGTVILLEDETEHKMLEAELLHSERLASIGRLAAGVAHEIGNPITGIDCLAQDLKYVDDPAEKVVIAEQIRQQADRVTKIVRSLVNFAHAGQDSSMNSHKPHSIHQIVQDAIDLLSLNRDSSQVIFINDVEKHLEVMSEPQRLAQVFINLLGNARDASNDNDPVSVESEVDGESVILTVTDQGSGIEKAVLDHIFDPFFTTKEVGKGTGLGLFLAYTIVEEHYGQISVQSPVLVDKGIGTRFTIRLPLHNSVTSGNN